jgi:hypothetical protein
LLVFVAPFSNAVRKPFAFPFWRSIFPAFSRQELFPFQSRITALCANQQLIGESIYLKLIVGMPTFLILLEPTARLRFTIFFGV